MNGKAMTNLVMLIALSALYKQMNMKLYQSKVIDKTSIQFYNKRK